MVHFLPNSPYSLKQIMESKLSKLPHDFFIIFN
jgi:hypothetical protein